MMVRNDPHKYWADNKQTYGLGYRKVDKCYKQWSCNYNWKPRSSWAMTRRKVKWTEGDHFFITHSRAILNIKSNTYKHSFIKSPKHQFYVIFLLILDLSFSNYYHLYKNSSCEVYLFLHLSSKSEIKHLTFKIVCIVRS